MKIGVVTTTNTKGQLVIPKKYRDKLNISHNVHLNVVLAEDGIFIHPIREVQHVSEKRRQLYRRVLKNIKGSWTDDITYEKEEKKRHKLELEATKRNQKAW